MEERTLVELLDSADSELRIDSAMNICNLPCDGGGGGGGGRTYRILQNGPIPPLLSMLCSINYYVVQSALFALLRLAFATDRTKIKIVKSGGVPLLVKLLKPEESGRSHTDLSSTMLMTLSTCSSTKQSIANSGAIQALLQLLHPQHKISQLAKHHALTSLRNLSTNKDNKQAIIDGGGVATLLRLLMLDNPLTPSDLCERALSILEVLTAASTAALEEVAAGGMTALVVAMEEGTSEGKGRAAAILVMMVRRSREKYREMILKEGAMAAVIQMSGEGREVGGELLGLLRRDYEEKNIIKKSKRRRCVVGMKKREALENIMDEIKDERVGSALLLVKQLIATLHKC